MQGSLAGPLEAGERTGLLGQWSQLAGWLTPLTDFSLALQWGDRLFQSGVRILGPNLGNFLTPTGDYNPLSRHYLTFRITSRARSAHFTGRRRFGNHIARAGM